MNTLNIPTQREETKTILGIGLPLTAAWVAEMAMFITDMIMVGRLGSKELAAVGLAGPHAEHLRWRGIGGHAVFDMFAALHPAAGMIPARRFDLYPVLFIPAVGGEAARVVAAMHLGTDRPPRRPSAAGRRRAG